jgi:thiol-disulfide isomerase/thioredoxin
VSRHPGRGGRPQAGRPGRSGRSPHAQALRWQRARRLWWAGAGAAVVAMAAVVVVIAVTAGGRTTAAGGTSAAGGAVPAVGSVAPGGSFTTVSGRTGTIASLRGRKSLLWFVATWCPSCQAGTQAMAGQAARLRLAGIEVVEVEDYADLGQPGPVMTSFARQLAGAAYHAPGWTFGTASRALTRACNPRGYLDVYFLLGSSGRVAYVNSAPASTMSQLLAHADGLT